MPFFLLSDTINFYFICFKVENILVNCPIKCIIVGAPEVTTYNYTYI